MNLLERFKKPDKKGSHFSFASQDILPWSVRLSMKCDDGRLNIENLETLVTEKFYNEALYLTAKALDGRDEQPLFFEDITSTLLTGSTDREKALSRDLRSYIANLPPGHKVDGTKLAQISRQGRQNRAHIYHEMTVEAVSQGFTPVLVAYSPIYDFGSFIDAIQNSSGSHTLGVILPQTVLQDQAGVGYMIDLDREKGRRVTAIEDKFPSKALLVDDTQSDDNDELSILREKLRSQFDVSIQIRTPTHFASRPAI